MFTTNPNALLVIAVLLLVFTSGGPGTLVRRQQASPVVDREVEQVREVIGRYDAEYWKSVDAASLVRNKQAAISTDNWWLALLRDKQLLVIETRTGHVAQRHAVQGDQLQWLDDAVRVTDSDGGGSESIQVRRQLLRYVDQRGESLPVNALVKANIGYLSTGSQWSTWPRRDGVISLAGLQRSTHWLVPQPHHEVFRVILPLVGDEIEQQRYVPAREPSPLSGDDFSVTTHVHKRSYDNAEMVRVIITNLTDKPIHVSEQDIHLDTEIDGRQFEVLSPIWRLAEQANFPAVDLPPQATSSLELDWNAWVNQGFWISGGVQVGLGPWPVEQRPGKVWVRVNVRHMGSLPIALTDPSHSIIDTAIEQQDKDMELQMLLGESKAKPAQFHGIARSTRNPMGWKWIVYLPPAQPLKIFGAIRPIPHVFEVKPRAEDVGYHIDPSPSGRVVQLEASLAVNTDGKWQLTVEADQDILQGTNLAVWVFHDEQAQRIARLASRQDPVDSETGWQLGVGRVTTKIDPKLELLSRTFVPQGLTGKRDVGDSKPGYCLWIQAVPDDPVAKDRFARLTQSPMPSGSSRKPDVAQELVLQHLFNQYINVNGKIPTAEVQAAIELVAARGACDRAFVQMVLEELEKRSRADNDRTVRRNLLAVITKWLHRDGARRWQHEDELRTGEVGQAAIPLDASVLYADTPMLAKVIQLGRLADSSDIDAYVLAVRGAHHPQSEAFLLDVLGNREAGGDPFEFYQHHPAPPSPETAWSDSMGGSWRDAKFHAAVGLAELGNSRGIEWLVAAVQPNDFGIDGTVYRSTHAKAPGGSLRKNSAYVLADLFGLPPTTTGPDWKAWWQKNKHPAVVGGAALIEW